MEGFNIMDILNGTTAAAATVDTFKDVRLNYQKIIVTKHNKYSMEEIEELQREFIWRVNYSTACHWKD